MADVKDTAHRLAIGLAGLASLEARMRKQLKSQDPSIDLDSHGAEVAVPVDMLKAMSKLGDEVIQLLSETSLIDPMRVKEEYTQRVTDADKEHAARMALMQALKGKLGKILGIGEIGDDVKVKVVKVGSMEELNELVASGKVQIPTDGDEEEVCPCPSCTMRREVLSGNLNVDDLDLPPGVKRVLKDYAEAVREEAAEDGDTPVTPNASMVPGSRRVLH